MYKLYYSPGACSMAVHVALNECNQPVTLEKVNLQETRSPEFLKINPRGQVPVLVDGDVVIREGAAILIYLLDKHQSPLLPAKGKERLDAIEWLMFCNATLHPAYARCFFLMRNAQDPAKEQLLGVAVAMINKLWNEVEQRLGQSAYLCRRQYFRCRYPAHRHRQLEKPPAESGRGYNRSAHKEASAGRDRATLIQEGARDRAGAIQGGGMIRAGAG